MRTFPTILFLLLFVGAGCTKTPVSSLTSEDAAADLVLAEGDEIVIQSTVFGLGGTIAGWFGLDEEERTISMVDWSVAEKASLSWSIEQEVETDESVLARAAYEQTYASSPVGTQIPDEPEPVYEVTTQAGTIATESLDDLDTLGLPETWPEGDGGISQTSLIWLSKAKYEELVNTRSTSISLGLFDESLMRVESATSRLTSIIDKLSGFLDPIIGQSDSQLGKQAQDVESLLTLEADPQWSEYWLLVDGVKTRVQAVKAKNAFASYKILANEQNPLILEIQLTPLSQGNIELLSKEGIAESFGGYEVTQVNKESPQPL